ncbi:MAG: ATP-binding cassette domain-containing protein, partial [Halocynthiibacter sp.]
MAASPDLTLSRGGAGLHIKNLRKSYRKRPVIRDVSMELGRGEVVALLGPNGSGKTTCFYA